MGAEDRDPVTGLTPAEAKEVLVTVGERDITLGDYVATLLRMDRFERLRYQTEDRQKKLLNEMIEVELLAQEAVRRGLDQGPEVKLQMQQALRDELLRALEASLPGPEEINEREVREYYEAHRSEFKEPERRRAMLIRVGSLELAKKVTEEAEGASGEEWGELAREYSLDFDSATQQRFKDDFAGDVGFVSAPGNKRGENKAVPDGGREEIFKLEKVGDVVPEPVKEEEFFYVVRMGGISPARDRTVAEADRAIRLELRRQKFLAAEKKLEADLRKKYPVKIDKKAIDSFQRSTQPPAQPPEKTKE
jgi:hypothetical protein